MACPTGAIEDKPLRVVTASYEDRPPTGKRRRRFVGGFYDAHDLPPPPTRPEPRADKILQAAHVCSRNAGLSPNPSFPAAGSQ